MHSVRVLVFQPRVEPVFSLSLSLFFTVACGNRPVFAESGRGLFLSLDRIQTAHDPIDRDSESALRTDQIPGEEGERPIRFLSLVHHARKGERESFNDRGPNRPCSPSVIFIAGQKMFSRTRLKREKYSAIANEIGRWNAEGLLLEQFPRELLQRSIT